MKIRNIVYLFLVLCSNAYVENAYAQKRKFEEEKEKEAEVIETKKPKISVRDIPRLQLLAAQQVIDNFLQPKSQKELQQVRNEYENLIPEMKEYITLVVNTPNAMGETYLHNAKNYWQIEQLKFLGADPNIVSKLGQLPITSMIAKGNIKAAEAFLEIFNKNPYILKDITRFTTLHYAIMTDARNLLQKMLLLPENRLRIQHHINELIGDEPGVSPLMLATQYSPSSLKILLKNGADINLANDEGITAFLYAAEYQDPSILQFLLAHGASLNDLDSDSENALFYAAKGNNIDSIKYLVQEKKLDINSKNADETTVLGAALEHGATPETIMTIVDLGASVNDPIQGVYEMISFLIRTQYDTPNLIKWFIDQGAELNYLDEESYPLAEAIFEEYDFNKGSNTFRENINYDLVHYLIDHGAKIMPQDKEAILNSGDQKLIELIQKAESLLGIFEKITV